MVTVIPRLYSSLRELKESGFSLEAVPARVEPTEMLMCEPTHFTVLDAKNPFMVNNVGACDTALAQKQWAEVRATYERLGYTVHALPGAAGLEDMVFSANQVLPGIRPDGARYVILSNMVHESRSASANATTSVRASKGKETRSGTQASTCSGAGMDREPSARPTRRSPHSQAHRCFCSNL
jgi:hypothetical protein